MLIFVLLALLCGGCSGQTDPSKPEFYTASSSDAYTWNRGYPQSCTCAQGGVLKTTCDMFRCSCICDVTAGVCDYNCCCDVDCSSEQVELCTDLLVALRSPLYVYLSYVEIAF
jgi:hypothetical protein